MLPNNNANEYDTYQRRLMLRDRIQGYLKTALRYEDEETKAKAMSVIPFERLHSEARDAKEMAKEFGNGQVLEDEDYLVESLTYWFKGEFFEWVTSPSCWNCGQNQTRAIQTTLPTPDEARHDASRVEVYQCLQCGAQIRFPRYNDPGKLMQTRRGRCGEWANAFTCLCRCLDIEARFVVDWTDHVWTEYYSQARGRWIHVDCCECVMDKPKLYEKGWGKKLSYVLAFDRYGAVDVTRRYVIDWKATLKRRREVDERTLEAMLKEITAGQRKKLSPDMLPKLNERDKAERTEFLNSDSSKDENESLPGRTTGSAEWRQQRGESGTVLPQRALRISTGRFRRIQVSDASGVEQSLAVLASGEKAPDETVQQLFDGRPDSKWLDFGGGGQQGSAWIELCLPKDVEGWMVTRYAMVSANDCPQRDPAEWELQGMVCDSPIEWKRVDHRDGIRFESRHERKEFQIETRLPCRRYRLCIWRTRDPSSADAVQLAQLELFPNKKTIKTEPLQLPDRMQQLLDLYTGRSSS